MAAPLLLLHGSRIAAPPPHGARPGSGVEATPSTVRPHTHLLATQLVGFDLPQTAPATTTTTTPPGPPFTTTTVAAPATTTTTAPPEPPVTTTSVPPAAGPVQTAAGSATGQVTWYAEAPPGGCASPSLPPGTEVEVVDDADGASTSCVVDDREATNGGGRLLDLSVTGFSSLAPVTQGVIAVTISW